MTAAIEGKDLLTVIEAAKVTNVSKATMLRAVNGQLSNTPKLFSVRLGTRILIRRETLTRWIAALEGIDSAA